MVHQRTEEQAGRLAVSTLAPAVLTIVMTGAGIVSPAGASILATGTGSAVAVPARSSDSGNGNGTVNEHSGNGRHNRNSFSINSPEINHGIQHITNTNVSGSTDTQAAFCKRRLRHCRISQRLVVFDP
jgi:hypothetical protein